MSKAAILEKLEQLLEHVQEDLVDYIELLHQKYVTDAEEGEPERNVIIGYDVDGTPKLASVMKEEYRRRLEEVKNGNYTTIEQLIEESKTW